MQNVLRVAMAAFAVIAITVGCSGFSSNTSVDPTPRLARGSGSAQGDARQGLSTPNGHLYVVRPYFDSLATPTPPPGVVTVFSLYDDRVTWTVPDADASEFQYSIAFDRWGYIYEPNEDANDVVVRPAHGEGGIRTIYAGLLHPFSVWFDTSGNLYVTNYPLLARPTPSPSGPPPTPTPSGPPPTPTPSGPPPTPRGGATLPPGWISIFAPGASRPFRRITSPNGYVPFALTFDNNGRLYVADGPADDNPNQNAGLVQIYSANSAHPERTISNGIHYPIAIAVDRAGTVYVGNAIGNVPVFRAGQSRPSYVLSAGLPNALLLDAAGNLYIADAAQGGSVSEYAPGEKKPIRSLSAGGLGVNSVALDASGNLYAADHRDNKVYVYAPGESRPLRIYSTLEPGFVAIGT